jgi:DNA-nicking Smr family endonuclease
MISLESRAMSDIDPPFDEPVVLPCKDVLDLHPFHPKDVPSVVEEFLETCRRGAILEVRLIHGKGAGIQRAIVRSLLNKHPAVISFKDAPAEAGGWGATIVNLRAG